MTPRDENGLRMPKGDTDKGPKLHQVTENVETNLGRNQAPSGNQFSWCDLIPGYIIKQIVIWYHSKYFRQFLLLEDWDTSRQHMEEGEVEAGQRLCAEDLSGSRCLHW